MEPMPGWVTFAVFIFAGIGWVAACYLIATRNSIRKQAELAYDFGFCHARDVIEGHRWKEPVGPLKEFQEWWDHRDWMMNALMSDLERRKVDGPQTVTIDVRGNVWWFAPAPVYPDVAREICDTCHRPKIPVSATSVAFGPNEVFCTCSWPTLQYGEVREA